MNEDFGFLFQVISRQIFRYFSSAGRELGISSIEVNILYFFFENRGKKIYQKDIENAFNIRSSTATVNINLMVKKNLIRRETDPFDQRKKILIPTDKAYSLENELRSYNDQLEKIIKTDMTAEEQDQLRKRLVRISDLLG